MPDRDRGRRQLVALITLIYLLLIFEGAARKWLMPSQGQLLFFIRDPFVLIAYFVALRHGFLSNQSALLYVGILFGFLGLVLLLAQLGGGGASLDARLMLAVYGWRNYFLYIPLAFVAGAALQKADLERIIRMTLLISVPVAVLVALQFRAPLSAPINVGIAEDVSQQFVGLAVTGDRTRPMGTFSSDLGQKQFVVSAMAMVLALWILPASRRFVKSWQLYVATGAVLSCLALSGSRNAMVHSGIVLTAALACSFFMRDRAVTARAVLLPTGLAAAAVILYPLVFPEGYGAFMSRWTAAAAAESQTFRFGIFGRALYSFVDFTSLLGSTPLAGYGLGFGGNARLTLGVVIEGFRGWAETDWARHIVDLGPVVGVGFIAYRVALVAWLGWTSLAGAMARVDPLPVLLFAYVSVELLYGQISGHGTVNGYAWLFTGFCIAAARMDSPGLERPQPVPAAEPRFPNLMR